MFFSLLFSSSCCILISNKQINIKTCNLFRNNRKLQPMVRNSFNIKSYFMIVEKYFIYLKKKDSFFQFCDISLFIRFKFRLICRRKQDSLYLEIFFVWRSCSLVSERLLIYDFMISLLSSLFYTDCHRFGEFIAMKGQHECLYFHFPKKLKCVQYS